MLGLRIESFPATALTQSRTSHDGMPDRGVTVASADPAILMTVHRPGVNLAIWHRDLPPTLSGASLRALLAAAPFTAIAVGAPPDLPDRLSAQLPAPAPLDLLLDLADLATVFTMLDGGPPRVRVRLEALVHDGCKKWHADSVGLRLLCTYRGPGTQWLPMDGGAPAARAMDGTPPGSIGQIPPGAVAVLKGERYPDNLGNGCIHRSPPAGPGPRARLLLCVDQTEWNLEE
jgi:hypothetical protein